MHVILGWYSTDEECRQLSVESRDPGQANFRTGCPASQRPRLKARRRRESSLTDETILAVAPQVHFDEFTRSVGDLVFTSNRILFAKTAGKTDVTAYLFGFVAATIAAWRSRKASQALRSQTVETLVAASEPRHRYEYSSLQSIEIRPRRLFSSVVVLRPREGKPRNFWGKRANILQLVAVAERLTAAGAPIRVI